MLFQEGDTVAAVPDDWITGAMQYPRGRGMNLQIEVSSLEPILSSLSRNQYPIYVPPVEKQRDVGGEIKYETEFLVLDPDGYVLRFSTPRRH
jgi:hypothetical protein